MMETKIPDGIRLIYEADQAQAAALFADACSKSVAAIRELWGLETPRDCRVHVMTSWLKFLFHSTTWPGKILLAIALPFLYFRFSRLWPLVAGWTFRLKRRPVVGVKPPALLARADTRLGARIYVREPSVERRAGNALCHELAHAFSGHLRLPLWLNEGIAMFTVDRFTGGPTIQAETIGLLERASPKTAPATYRNLMRRNDDGIVYNYARSYWVVRYLEELHPGLLKSLLARRRNPKEIEKQVSLALGLRPDRLWKEIDGRITAHFKV